MPKRLSHPVKPDSAAWFRIQASAQNDTVEVMIYDEIGAYGMSAKQFASELAASATGKQTIKLHLHSLGGDVFEGLAIYNLLKNHPATIEVHIGGVAASMGSVIAMAGDKIYLPENAWIMLHQPRGGKLGKAEEMRAYADLLDKLQDSMVSAYAQKTGLADDEIKQMMNAETWLMGKDALSKGFADQLIQPVHASAFYTQHQQEFKQMPEQLSTLITPQQPAKAIATPETVAAVNKDQQAFQQQEQARRSGIRAQFKQFDGRFNALRDQCLDDMNINLSMAKDQLLRALGSEAAPAAGGQALQFHVGNGAIVQQTLANALAARAEVATLEKDNPYRGMTLVEMARMSLTEKGLSAYGLDRMELVGRAFTHTSSDFGNILSDVARLALLKGFDEAKETFQIWTKKGLLADFKPAKRVGLESFPVLDQVVDGGEYRYASLSDTGETIQLATYGKMFSITRQTIINDDLGAFSSIPARMGRAAIRTIGNLVYAVLMNPPNMSDGKPLFHAEHNNLIDAALLSAETLDAAAQAMAMQEDSKGSVLNIEPAFLIVPRGLKTRANMLMNSQFDPDGKHANVPNTVHKLAQVVADARIDKAVGANPLPWFLCAGAGFDTIEVSYLDGNDQPYLEQKQGWSVDGSAFKVRIDAGVSPLSYRTLIKNPGL